MLTREVRAILAIAPTPAEAARLTRSRLRGAVTRAGWQRRIETETDRLLRVLRRTSLHQPALLETAMGRQTLALLAQLDAACRACEGLARDTENLFLRRIKNSRLVETGRHWAFAALTASPEHMPTTPADETPAIATTPPSDICKTAC